jgi:NADP-dependent aldehyde dehydrogenase
MAGCPVVVKGHPSHPGTCELAARVIREAVQTGGFPEGTFSLLQGAGNEVGAALVAHPATAAVGFTGSLRGGRALFNQAAARATPVPFYAEMGSVNPQYVLPGLLEDDPAGFADSLFASVTLGNGQFCTNPGLVFVPEGKGSVAFLARLRERAAASPAEPMLNAGIRGAYAEGVAALASLGDVQLTGGDCPGPGFRCRAAVAELSLNDFERHRDRLEEEVFGPVTVVVRCPDTASYTAVASGFPGQLATSIHGNASDLEAASALVDALTRFAGRLVINGFPTGIEICQAMHHGGPYPAATSSRFTSIGLASIARWSRPVAFQNTPDHLLPKALQEKNPLGIPRTVDGTIQPPANQPPSQKP